MPPRGFKRSRALWDNTKREHESRWETFLSYATAILYEIQPVRISKSDFQGYYVSIRKFLQSIQASIPRVARSSWNLARNAKFEHWLVIPGVIGYYYFIKYAHETMNAGPLVLIATVLTMIFTFGLGDESEREGLSAYSMFNRGFERLLGTLNAEDLVAQQVGGVRAQQEPDELPARPARQEQRRHQQANPEPRNEQDQNGEGQPRNAARRSGKKARRQNLEQRQEMRRQREAAIALGFGNNDEQDAIAMNRLIEEQIANGN